MIGGCLALIGAWPSTDRRRSAQSAQIGADLRRPPQINSPEHNPTMRTLSQLE